MGITELLVTCRSILAISLVSKARFTEARRKVTKKQGVSSRLGVSATPADKTDIVLGWWKGEALGPHLLQAYSSMTNQDRSYLSNIRIRSEEPTRTKISPSEKPFR